MATGIAKSGIGSAARSTVRVLSRPRALFSLVLVIALFGSSASAFGVVAPTSRFTRISYAGTPSSGSYALAGALVVSGAGYGLLGSSTNDGTSWGLGLAGGPWFTGASAWPGGPVWGSTALGLWTSTGASTITPKNPPSDSSCDWRDIAYDGTSAIAVGMRNVAPYGEPAQPATIWKTSDGGDSWTQQLLAPDYAPPLGGGVPAQAAAVLDAVDAVPGLAVAVGTEYPQEDFNHLGTPKQALIYTSTDGGSTWTTQTAGVAAQLLDVDVVSSGPTGVVWAVGSLRRLFRSLDGGVTWENVTPPNDNTSPATTYGTLSVAGVDSSHAYIVGTNGKIGYVTASGALSAGTWSFFTAGGALHGIAARDGQHAIAVGDNGLMLRTTTGMGGWAAKTVATTPALSLSTASGFALDPGTPVHIAGTSSDAGLGIAQVQVRIHRSDGTYWDPNTSSWDTIPRWISASTSDGWANYAYDWTVDSTCKPGVHSVDVTVRAINGNGASVSKTVYSAKVATSIALSIPSSFPWTGNYVSATLRSPTNTVITGRTLRLYTGTSTKYTTLTPAANGSYRFKLAPVNKTSYRILFAGDSGFNASPTRTFTITPGVRLYTPKASRSSSTYTVTTYIAPRHASRAVRVYAYRYVSGKWSTSAYKYAYGYAYYYNSTTTRMVAKISLPRGKWRFRAYAAADSYHVATWSAYTGTYTY